MKRRPSGRHLPAWYLVAAVSDLILSGMEERGFSPAATMPGH
jgi:hypothetical protein